MIKTCFFLTVFTLVFLRQVIAADLKTYKVYLKEGTILIKLKDKTNHVISRGIYAHVLEIDPLKRDRFIVYDKTMRPVFETSALGVVEIEKDIAILPDIDAETIYPAPTVFKANNKNAFFDTQFNFYIDNINLAPLNNFYESEVKSALGTRFEVRTLYSSDLPVNFGLNLSYQTANWPIEDDTVKFSALSFGPHIQRYVYQEEKMAVSLILGAEYSPLLQTTSEEFKFKYHAIMLNLATEFLWQTDYGKISAGINYRKYDLNLINLPNKEISVSPEDISLFSIGVMVGYKYEWDL